MAYEALLAHVPVPPGQVFRVPTEYPPGEAAQRYEQQLRSLFHGEGPVFDMVLLGLGTDGHTASLFPGTAALQEEKRWVTVVHVPRLASWRVTLTFPALNAARRALFLVLGASKADIVAQVLRGPEERYPAQRVRPASGCIGFWMRRRRGVDGVVSCDMKNGTPKVMFGIVGYGFPP